MTRVQALLSLSWRWAKRALFLGLALGAVTTVGLVLVLRKFEAELPPLSDLKGNYRPPQTTRILARDGTILAELYTERRTVVPVADLPSHVKLAFLAAEDASFFEHEGLNYWGIARALLVNLRTRKFRQGGSTITQQVIKNVVLGPERTLERKVKEALLARKLEQELTKEEILGIYLNQIYFGHGRYGVEEAARGTFGKSSKDLTIAEGAMLAGVVKGPELYSPHVDLQRAIERRNHVLEQMRMKGFLDEERSRAAEREPAILAPAEDRAGGGLVPELVEFVRRELHERDPEGAARGGYTIQTTIDRHLQEAARKALRENLEAYDKRHGLLAPYRPPTPKLDKKGRPQKVPLVPNDWKLWEGTPRAENHRVYVGEVVAAEDEKGRLDVRVGTVVGSMRLSDYDRYNPGRKKPSEYAMLGDRVRVSFLGPAGAAAKAPLRLESGPESAFVAIDLRSRDVLAWVGNYEALAGGLDRATHSKRQPGSTFKPIVYSYAIHSRRFTPASLIDVRPATFSGGYRPSNFEGWKGSEPLRLREALAQSVNLAAIRVLEDVGPAAVVDWATSLGIRSPMKPDLSLGLGSYEVTPLELAGAYATIGAGGMYQAPRVIVRIAGPDGKEIELSPLTPSHRVMEEAEAFVTTHMMTSVVEHGTAVRAKELRRPVAGKTGTSNQSKDTWFAGFSTEIAAVVWVGFDDGKPLGPAETGAQTALPAWVSFMKIALEKRPASDFPIPEGVVTERVDAKTGLVPYEGDTDTVEEVFLRGTEPTEVARPFLDGGTSFGDAGGGPGEEDRVDP